MKKADEIRAKAKEEILESNAKRGKKTYSFGEVYRIYEYAEGALEAEKEKEIKKIMEEWEKAKGEIYEEKEKGETKGKIILYDAKNRKFSIGIAQQHIEIEQYVVGPLDWSIEEIEEGVKEKADAVVHDWDIDEEE